MREGDHARCRHCGKPIYVALEWSGLQWQHTGRMVYCFITKAEPVIAERTDVPNMEAGNE